MGSIEEPPGTFYLDSCISCHIFHNEKRTEIAWMTTVDLFIYLGFYIAFNTVQVISRRVVGRAEETSTYSLLGFCTVNC